MSDTLSGAMLSDGTVTEAKLDSTFSSKVTNAYTQANNAYAKANTTIGPGSTLAGDLTISGNLTIGEKLATFILIVASLNIFVGIFNLLPILPLDGGHMAVAIFEGVRRRIAKVRGKPNPGPVDVEKLTPITMIVLVLLIFLTSLLLIADIFNPINLNL